MAAERHPDPRGVIRDYGAGFILTPDGPLIDFNEEFLMESARGPKGERVMFFVPKPMPLIIDADFLTGNAEKHLSKPLSDDWLDIGGRAMRFGREIEGRAGLYVGNYRVELRQLLNPGVRLYISSPDLPVAIAPHDRSLNAREIVRGFMAEKFYT